MLWLAADSTAKNIVKSAIILYWWQLAALNSIMLTVPLVISNHECVLISITLLNVLKYALIPFHKYSITLTVPLVISNHECVLISITLLNILKYALIPFHKCIYVTTCISRQAWVMRRNVMWPNLKTTLTRLSIEVKHHNTHTFWFVNNSCWYHADIMTLMAGLFVISTNELLNNRTWYNKITCITSLTINCTFLWYWYLISRKITEN